MSLSPLEKFQSTVDLIAKNKLNRHNAFEYRIEDLGLLLFNNSENPSGTGEWMHHSILVDTLGKVYGYCVDHLFYTTLDLLGGVNRTKETEHEITPINVIKNKNKGADTLETDESKINFKDSNRIEDFDPYFDKMKKNFDCPNSETMIFNTICVDSLLNLVLSGDDCLSSEIYLAEKAEINLEGLITFSLNELVHNDISIKLDLISKNLFTNENNFEEIWNKIGGELADNQTLEELPLPILESENEDLYDNNAPPLFSSNENIEERIISMHFKGLENSENVIRFNDNLEVNILSKKKKKRVRKIENIQEVYSNNLAIIRIEETENNSFRRNGGLNRNTNNRNRIEDSGYRESKLTTLFTRKGNFFGTERIEKVSFDEWDTLCIDPNIGLGESDQQNYKRRTHFNFRVLIEDIWSVLKEEEHTKFLDVVNQINIKYENDAMSNLSIHSCFMGILHLANEHNLYLEKQDECDFTIKPNIN